MYRWTCVFIDSNCTVLLRGMLFLSCSIGKYNSLVDRVVIFHKNTVNTRGLSKKTAALHPPPRPGLGRDLWCGEQALNLFRPEPSFQVHQRLQRFFLSKNCLLSALANACLSWIRRVIIFLMQIINRCIKQQLRQRLVVRIGSDEDRKEI
jgi:hypothetical protein